MSKEGGGAGWRLDTEEEAPLLVTPGIPEGLDRLVGLQGRLPQMSPHACHRACYPTVRGRVSGDFAVSRGPL